MSVRLEFVDGSASKFWEVEARGKDAITYDALDQDRTGTLTRRQMTSSTRSPRASSRQRLGSWSPRTTT